MKKTLSALFAFLLVTSLISAQDDGAKLAKSAGKALTSYNIDPSNNGAKLDEAKQKIEQALKTPEAQAMASAWITKGDIYNTLLQKDMTRRMIDPKAPLTGDNDALEAFTAYKSALALPNIKKFEKSDAIKGVTEVQGSLINIGVNKYEAQEYEKAYNSFSAALSSHDLLSGAGQKSLFDDPKQLDDQTYITALAASLCKKNAEAIALYEKLIKKGSAKAEIYDGLYRAKLEMGDEAAADAILTEARKAFPDDASLLFSEINSYLKKGKLDELISRLTQAIEKEPNNVSLYVTLGSVYDNLYQRETAAKNDAKAAEHLEMAKKYYTMGSEKDPKNVDAIYALGTLYYNKAALRTQELNALPEDYSAAGIKKYEGLKKEILALFDQALPYFQKAESLDANDRNTLIALTEIYARKEDDLAIEFKKRLETVNGGGKNAGSYFKQ